MNPTARIIPPGYVGPSTCTRCGKVAKEDAILVSENPTFGEWNPDICMDCLKAMNAAARKAMHDRLAADLKEFAISMARLEFGRAIH